MEFAMHFVNPLRKMFLCAFLLWAALASAAESHTWLPVDPKDLQMKEFKQIPGAEAVLLYYQNEIDDVNHTDFLYSRIKVLTDSGKRHANVEIPMTEKTSVMDLVARTIHPDGRIVDLTDRPFEKVVFQGKGLRVRVQAFTLPQVSAGDIIEYRYELHYKGLLHHHWTVQHDLYAVKEHFRFRYDKKYSVKWLSTAGLQQSPEHDTKSGVLQMDSENVAPFEAEEQMPPEEGYKLQVKFFYTSPFMGSPSAYWYETGRWWSQGVDYFLGNHKEIVSAATEAVGNETDPEKKLRKLYARAQEIRNLTYERQRTQKEQKREELKDNKNVVEILRHGYGDRNDVTRFFVALARGAGFTASVVFVSSRQSRLFDREVLSFGQLDSEIAGVRLNGKRVFLDPGTRYSPYGLLRWIRTGTAAMDMSDPGHFINTPGAGEEGAIVSRSAELKLSPDGAAKGEVRIEFSGADALERRLAALETDEAGRKKEFEDEVKLWLPANAKVEMTDSVAWEKEYEPLTAVFKVEVPEFASAAGKRLLIPTALFLPKIKRVLKSGPRKYPIYYHYAFTEIDAVSLELPEGYSAETLATPQTTTTKFGSYSSSASATGKRVNLERSLMLKGIFFQPDRYDELREFFVKVQTGDELQTVLRQGPTAEAKKAN
ncbi:MAG TPA: DUF3857 domain-containing protein [Candidatus Polarisedimenticolia bacterium]|nr:DUF3857 domain-containing protein [Candidatus Polarisedimenticolia bacterium]